MYQPTVSCHLNSAKTHEDSFSEGWPCICKILYVIRPTIIAWQPRNLLRDKERTGTNRAKEETALKHQQNRPGMCRFQVSWSIFGYLPVSCLKLVRGKLQFGKTTCRKASQPRVSNADKTLLDCSADVERQGTCVFAVKVSRQNAVPIPKYW